MSKKWRSSAITSSGPKGKVISLNPIRFLMSALIDGKEISKAILEEVRSEVHALQAKGLVPKLKVILVGEDPASISYVTGKARTAQEVGMDAETIRLPSTTDQHDLVNLINRLNADVSVHGILVQSPLPDHLSEGQVFRAISPMKDVDCLHPENVGLLALGTPRVVPCTPMGILELLLRSGNSPEGKHVVIIGRSSLVGRPLSILLSLKRTGSNATVTLCHSSTRELKRYTLQAEVLVAAIGAADAIKKDMVPEGCVVIDVGINRIPDPSKRSGFRLVGDVDFEEVLPRVKAITPVPGGVGPMTVAMLMKNSVRLARLQTGDGI